MRIKSYLLGILCGLLPVAGFTGIPFNFEAGTPALAAEVNANFGNLDTRLNASFGALIVSQVSAQDDGVVGAMCPSDRLVASAGCHCDNVGGTRNFGVLFGCGVVGNGGVAGCFPEGTTFNSALPPPLATVNLVCLSGRANDGTPLEPTPVVLSGLAGSEKSISTSVLSGTDNAAQLDAATEFEVALKTLQDQVMDHSIRLQSR